MANISEEIERIAKEYLRVSTLQTRRSDALDFYDLAVWEIRAALTAAYMSGASHGKPEKQEGSEGSV